MYAARPQPNSTFRSREEQEYAESELESDAYSDVSSDDVSQQHLSPGLAAPLHDGHGVFFAESFSQGSSATDASFEFIPPVDTATNDSAALSPSSSPREPLSPLLSGTSLPNHHPKLTTLNTPRDRRASELHDLRPIVIEPRISVQPLHVSTISKQQKSHSHEDDLLHSVHAISAGLHKPRRRGKRRLGKMARESDKSSKRSRASGLEQENLSVGSRQREGRFRSGLVKPGVRERRRSRSLSQRPLSSTSHESPGIIHTLLRIHPDTNHLLTSVKASQESVLPHHLSQEGAN